MKFSVEITINGELEFLRELNIEEIKELQNFLKKYGKRYED